MNVTFLFPGQGSQAVGMGKQLHENFSAARLVFEEASDSLSMNIACLCFEGPESELTLTENTQPAVLTVSVAAFKAFESESGARPVVAAGHSLGEYSALVAAGAIELADAVRLVRDRGRFMQEAAPEGEGAMAAVIGMNADMVDKLAREVADETGKVIVPANYNAPDQIVVSGHAEAVEVAAERAKERGAKKVVFLNVSAPFHSPLMKPAAERLAEKLAEAPFAKAQTPVIANVNAEPYDEPEKARDLLEKQVCSPVLWMQSMKKLTDFEVEAAFELGPGKVLTGLLRKIDRELKCVPVGDVDGLKKALDIKV